MTDEERAILRDLEQRLVDVESQLGNAMAQLEQRHAVAPPRPPNQSVIDLVERLVEESITPKFDSLMPIQEEQLRLLQGSAAERELRAAREKKWSETKRLGFAIITCIIAVCELARALLAH